MSRRRADYAIEQPPAALWEEPEVRAALRHHDIKALMVRLMREGYSQRKIAALTGQQQSEISVIIHGRKIVTYGTLVRIATGLGIPRGYLGLSWCERDCPPVHVPAPR